MRTTLTIRMAAHCMLALASLLRAQEVVLEAPSIDAVWKGHDGIVRAQCGRRIVLLTDPVRSVAVPAEAIAFDHGACLAWAGSDAFSLEDPEGKPRSRPGVFPLRPEAALLPLRVPLFLTTDLVAAPTTSAVAVLDRRTGAAFEIDAPPRRSRTHGYGLTGEIVDDLTVPAVFGFQRGNESFVLFGSGRSFTRVGKGVATALPAVDLEEGEAIEGFEHVVPPLFADCDQDGVPDLIRASKTAVVFQGKLDRTPIPAPVPILLNGPILAIAAADMDSDGKDDLVVARLPELTPLQQLSILTESKVSATVLAYSMAAGGTPPPFSSVPVTIGVKVAVHEDRRRADVQDLVAFGAGRILVATPGSAARLIDAAKGKTSEIGKTPGGRWIEPLRPCRAGGDVYGVLETGGSMRLVRFRLN